jgi:hypothetical protein
LVAEGIIPNPDSIKVTKVPEGDLGRTARTSLGIQGIDFCAGILWSQKIPR